MSKKKQDPDAPKSGKDLARKPRGFPDRREALIHAQGEMIDRVTAVYRRWGFEALDTGAFEYADALGLAGRGRRSLPL